MASVSRIEEIIDDIEDYIESCKYVPFSAQNVMVSKSVMEDLIRELRMKTPEEIKRYQKIIANREAILEDAQMKAHSMLEEANRQTAALVSEHEVMQQAVEQATQIVNQATQQAQQILDDATIDANEIRISAMEYTDDLLKSLQHIIGHAMDSASAKYDSLIFELKKTCDVVDANRASLGESLGTAPVQEYQQPGYQEQDYPQEQQESAEFPEDMEITYQE